MKVLLCPFVLALAFCSCKDVADVVPNSPDSQHSPEDPPLHSGEEHTLATPGKTEHDSPAKKTDEREINRTQQANRSRLIELRQAQIGKTYESLTLGTKTFEGATVDSISDTHIKIRHPNGIAMIPWEDVQPHAQAAWGFDPQTLKNLQARQEAELAEVLRKKNDPERLAILDKRRKEQARKTATEEREMARQQIKNLEAEIKRGKAAVVQLEQALADVKRKYLEEDADADRRRANRSTDNKRIGGIKTSRHVREREIKFHTMRVNAAKQKLAELKSALRKLE